MSLTLTRKFSISVLILCRNTPSKMQVFQQLKILQICQPFNPLTIPLFVCLSVLSLLPLFPSLPSHPSLPAPLPSYHLKLTQVFNNGSHINRTVTAPSTWHIFCTSICVYFILPNTVFHLLTKLILEAVTWKKAQATAPIRPTINV